jgi:[acyl-carrier-protein] S-malonyltransferase
MNKLAVVFTGQGSQFAGMGIDDLSSNAQCDPYVKAFKEGLGYDPLSILKSANEELSQTIYAQPMILLLSICYYELFKELNASVEGFLGFSLGEFTALYASGAIGLNDSVKLIKQRALWMQQAAEKQDGAMAAVLGLDAKNIITLCQQVSNDTDFVMPVNFNSLEQTVISGNKTKIEEVSHLLKAAGAKRVLPLAVNGAFHTPYMASVSKKLTGLLENEIQLNDTRYPIYLNTTAKPHQTDELITEISRQVASPVYFHQAITEMKQAGFTHFIEIGPKAVLTALIKKIDSTLEVISMTSSKQLDDVKGWLKSYGFIT